MKNLTYEYWLNGNYKVTPTDMVIIAIKFDQEIEMMIDESGKVFSEGIHIADLKIII